jgi:hypothetical protein
MQNVRVAGYEQLRLADIMPLPGALERVRIPVVPSDPDSPYFIEVQPARTAPEREMLRAALEDSFIETGKNDGVRVGSRHVPYMRGPIQFLRLCFQHTVTDYWLPTPEARERGDVTLGVACPPQGAPNYERKRADQISKDFDRFIGTAYEPLIDYLEAAFRQVHRCTEGYLEQVVDDLGNSDSGASAPAPPPDQSSPSSSTAPSESSDG